MQIPDLASEWQKRIKPFFIKKETISTYRSCITFNRNELLFLYLNHVQDNIELLAADILHFNDLDSLSVLLRTLHHKYSLGQTPAYWLLQPDDYQLFTLESLPVPREEINKALQWRLRSLLNYSVEEAIIDYFTMPDKMVAPQKTMMDVVTARRAKLQPLIDLILYSDFKLSVIDVPELALRNLAALHENDEKSTAMLYCYNHSAIINITHQKKLYFTRRLTINPLENSAAKDIREICLDIIRYFDYFQSQWRIPAPSRLLFITDHEHVQPIAKRLSESLLLPVEKYSLEAVHITGRDVIRKFEDKLLLPLGCALRKDIKDAHSGN